MTCPEQSCKLTSKTNTLTIILLFSSLIPIACNTIFHNVLLHSTVHVFQLQGLKLHVNVHSRLFSNYTKFCCCHCFFLQKISVIRKPFLVHAIFFTYQNFFKSHQTSRKSGGLHKVFWVILFLEHDQIQFLEL